jgi:acyl-CoA hydrolase
MQSEVDLRSLLRSDDLIVVPQGTAEPLALTRRLVADEAILPSVTVFVGALFSTTFDSSTALRFASYGGLGRTSVLVAAGKCEVVPSSLSQLPRLFESESLGPDVVFLHLSAESQDGRHSVGIVDDYLRPAADQARVLIGQINRHMPFIPGSTTFSLDELDGVIFADEPLLEVPSRPADEQSRRVAENVARFIDDGSCLQLGIGAIPDALAGELAERQDLSIHTGLMTDAFYSLHSSSAVTNASKSEFSGRSVIGTVFATSETYEQMADDETLRMQPVGMTHSHDRLAAIPRLVSVNSAIEVDLMGQVNSEMAGGRYVGAVGGLVDFVRGASASENGRSIIAFKSTDRRLKHSRIVPPGTPDVVTCGKDSIDTVVTEYGAAEIKGCDLAERRRRLSAIAHPKFRDDLLGAGPIWNPIGSVGT